MQEVPAFKQPALPSSSERAWTIKPSSQSSQSGVSHAWSPFDLPLKVRQAAVMRTEPSSIGRSKRRICCRHDLWQLHGLRIITRSHTYAASHVSPELQQAEGGPTAQRATKGVVMRAKMEYQGLGEEDREEVTLEEQAAWWLALKLRPGSSLLVRAVSLPAPCLCVGVLTCFSFDDVLLIIMLLSSLLGTLCAHRSPGYVLCAMASCCDRCAVKDHQM